MFLSIPLPCVSSGSFDSHSYSRFQVQPRFIPILYQFHRLFPLPSVASAILVFRRTCRLLLLFIDITKEITNKLKTNRSIFVSKTTENQIKHTVTQMSKMSHFSPIQVFLLIVYVGVLACTRREMGNVVFSFPPFPPKFSYTFFIPTELE